MIRLGATMPNQASIHHSDDSICAITTYWRRPIIGLGDLHLQRISDGPSCSAGEADGSGLAYQHDMLRGPARIRRALAIFEVASTESLGAYSCQAQRDACADDTDTAPLMCNPYAKKAVAGRMVSQFDSSSLIPHES